MTPPTDKPLKKFPTHMNQHVRMLMAEDLNRPFPSSLERLFQSESKCERFAMVISSASHMSENWFSFQRLRTVVVWLRNNRNIRICTGRKWSYSLKDMTEYNDIQKINRPPCFRRKFLVSRGVSKPIDCRRFQASRGVIQANLSDIPAYRTDIQANRSADFYRLAWLNLFTVIPPL